MGVSMQRVEKVNELESTCIKTTVRERTKTRRRPFRALIIGGLLAISSDASADITGNAFRDYNNNGVDDGASEQGLQTIVVTAYDSAGAQAATATTNASGNYTLTLGSGNYRIEFTLPSDGSLDFLRPAVSPNSSVQFAANGATVNAGFNSRAQYSDPTPDLVTSIYRHGSAVGDTASSLLRFDYGAGCEDANLDGVCDVFGESLTGPAAVELASTDEVGATMGMAFDRTNDALFVASFMKRHAGFQRNGQTGVIYRIADPNGSPGTPTAYVDFDALGIDTGTDPHPADSAADVIWEQDANSWDAVGKVGFGDLEISEDDTKLYAVNLFDRRLYTIPIQSDPVTLADISSIAIPNPCSNVNDFRPFATKTYDSRVYVGVTCTGQSSVTANAPAQLQHLPAGSPGNLAALPGYGNRNLLSAHVMAYDPVSDQFESLAGTPSTAPVFSAPLSYPRERSIGSSLPNSATSPGEWNPWTPEFIVYDRDFVAGNCLSDRAYPQPWLTDIEFDRGNMILGIRDRFGDQTGYLQSAPPPLLINSAAGPGCSTSSFANQFNGITAGDTLRACGSPQAGWSLENNASCGGITTPGANTEGPGGGEYYYQDDYDDFPNGSFQGGFHNDISSGGLAHVPGTILTVSTMYDPIDLTAEFNDGGIFWLNGDTGARERGYRLYNSSDAVGQLNLDDTFAKANGLGDLEPLSESPSIEIGNYVWLDGNGDGVQDAAEPGVSSVTVQLWADLVGNDGIVDTQVGTDTTDGNGNYNFGGETDANLNSGSLLANTAYEVRIDRTQASVSAFGLAPQNNGTVSGSAANADARDSDAANVDIAGTDTAVITYTTGNFGANDDSLDIGFVPPVSIGSFVWNDSDGDGIQDSAELGIANATLALFVENSSGAFIAASDINGGAVATITTTANGQYRFSGIPSGRYQVQVTPPSGFEPTPIQVTSADNNAQNDSNVASEPSVGVYRSPTMTVTFQTEPNESNAFDGDAQDGTAGSDEDLSGNMTVDFGFVTPVSIGSFVWEDLDVDGVQDAGEPGIENAAVALLVEDPNNAGAFIAATDIDSVAVANVTTGADGLYEFDNLPPGDYRVRVTPPSGFVATPTQDTAANSDTLASDELDSNIASEPITGTFESATFTLNSLGEPEESDAAAGDGQDGTTGSNEDRSGNMTVDFGFVAPMSLGSFVWQDTDGDGIQDVGEPAISGAVVTLFRDSGASNFVQVTTDINGATIGTGGVLTTGADGLYQFDNLPEGDYRVRVTPPIGFVPSPIQDAANNADTVIADELDSNIASEPVVGTYESGTFTLSEGDEPNESDAAAGDNQDGTQGSAGDLNGNNTIDFGFIAPISIGSFVFNDANGDGTQDATELGIVNATVDLFVENGSGIFIAATDLNGAAVGTITTLANGLYEFSNLPPGNYQVQVSPPAGFEPTPTQVTTNDSNAEGDSNIASELSAGVYRSPTMTLTSGGEPNEADTFNGDTQDGTAGSPDDLSGNMTVDFGFVVPVSIGSFVWEDLNVDGIQDAGEPGIENATVSLLVEDAGVFIAATDIDSAAVANVTTVADGLYEFDNLPPGDYRVRVTPPGGFVATPTQDTVANSDTLASDELDSNIASEPVTGTFESATFTLNSLGEPQESDVAAGDTQDGVSSSNEDLSGNMTVDFGFVAPMSIGSFVWQDTDGDGIQDAGEPGIGNASVALLIEDPNNAGAFIAATDITGAAVTNVTTGADGLYEFDNLPPGDYRVRATPPAGFVESPVQDTANNSDTLASDELDSNIASEPVAGTYESGTFTLSEGDEPNESDAAAGDNQDGTQGSAGDLNGNNTIDFGFIAPISIGSFVWNDADGDGVQDAGEAGIENATVALLVEDPNNAGVFIAATDIDNASVTNATTGANGLYEFDNLPPGNYKVRVTPPTGFDPSPVQDGANNSDTQASDELDSNINTNATGLTVGTYESGEFTLTSGDEPNEADAAAGDDQDATAGSPDDLSGNMTVDFGFVTPVSIGSFVWEDLDVDGVQDAGEPGIVNATVALLVEDPNNAGAFIAATDIDNASVTNVTTGADGLYEFDNLPPGDYRVRVTPPSGFVATPTQDTAANSDTLASDELDSNIASEPVTGTFESETFTLNSLGEPEESDAAAGDGQDGTTGSNEDRSGNMTVDFGFVAPMSLGSFVWQDTDGDGVQDAGEPGIGNASVALLVEDPNNAGAFIAATDITGAAVTNVTTSATGVYEFINLPPGDYRVRVTPPAGFVESPAQDTANNSDTLASDELDSNIASEPAAGTYESGTFTLSEGDEPNESDAAAGDNQDGTQGSAGDLNGNNTIDFGFIAPISIGSFVFNDANGDGTQDATELGIVNATVDLFVENGSGIFIAATDLNGAAVGTITTLANGLYEFSNLPPGNYQVQVSPPAGFEPTPTQVTTNDSNAEGDSNIASELSAGVYRSPTMTLTSGGEPNEADTFNGDTQDGTSGSPDDLSGNMTVDFGFVVPVSIGSFVWEDLNVDGIQDAGEPGIENATVSLLVEDAGVFIAATDIDSAAVANVTTVADGLYEFDNLPPGDYRVRVTPPGGFVATPTQDTVANSDTLASDELDSNIASEPVTGTFESATFTLNSLGEPQESDVAAGDTQDGVSSSNEDLSGNMTVDFGFVAPMSIGSFVWQDTDGDGIQDSDEPPLAGVLLELLRDNGAGGLVAATDINGAAVASTTTSANGLYRFDNLPNGDYVVQATPSDGVFPSPVQTTADNSDALVSDELDSNIASSPANGVYQSGMYTLDSFTEPVESDSGRGDIADGSASSASDLNGNMTVDFGFSPTATIGNFVWLDIDRDGRQDSNEEGIANVTVNLYQDTDGDGSVSGAELTTPVRTVVTGTNGEYLFPGLEPGVVYISQVDESSLPANFTQTFDEGATPDVSGVLDHTSDPITLDPEEEHLTADFGYAPPLGSIGDTIWIDVDDDGVQDPEELGIPGVTVQLTPAPDVDPDGSGPAAPGDPITVVTDENGKYLFSDLPLDETYVVEVLSGVPSEYSLSSSGLGDPDVRDGTSEPDQADDQTVVVLTTDDPIILNADFGYLPNASVSNSIGDTVWRDLDGDGNGPVGAGDESDLNEPPIANVTVTLIQDNGDGVFNPATDTVIATGLTDANGRYLFTGLPDGDYLVFVSDQNNVLAGLAQTVDADDPANPGSFTATTPNISFVDDLGMGIATPVMESGQDFGYVEPNIAGGVGQIGDTIFFDEDNSNSPDPGEGLEGVVVQLFGPGPDGVIGTADDILIATEVTDENGNYLFTGLDTSDTGPNPGTDYRVVVVPSSLPNGGDGWINSVDPNTPNPGDNESVTTLTGAAPVNLDQDFGYVSDDMNSLSGTVWSDTNGDGELVETGRFAGVTIELRDEDGNIVQTTTSDANGDFGFTNLPDGVYTVVITDEDNVLNGYEHTDSPNGSSDTSDQTSKDDTGYVVDLDSAGVSADPVTDETSDFGYQPVVTNPISLGSFYAASADRAKVLIQWTTQTEVANLGFKLYGRIDGQWIQLNERLILGLGDSVSTQRYDALVSTSATVFAISDVDLKGTETLHGPYRLGQKYGSESDRSVIDWSAEKAERERKRARRTLLRMQQQQQRLNRRMNNAN